MAIDFYQSILEHNKFILAHSLYKIFLRNLLPAMMYAIVDIETTGSYAAANGITEISIHVLVGDVETVGP